MKLPRGLAADRQIRALERLGYVAVRQKGSHIQLQHPGPPEHTVTVPQHRPIRVGTQHSILVEVAQAQALSIESILDLI